MGNIVIVGIGGFLGSISRYVLSEWVGKICGAAFFHYGTFAVNIIGCLVIGFLASFAESKHYISHQTRLFLLVGFLGGFTTFSSLCGETFTLMNNARILHAMANIALSVTLGLGAVWLGYKISTLI